MPMDKLHHELAITILMIGHALLALLWGMPVPTGTWHRK